MKAITFQSLTRVSPNWLKSPQYRKCRFFLLSVTTTSCKRSNATGFTILCQWVSQSRRRFAAIILEQWFTFLAPVDVFTRPDKRTACFCANNNKEKASVELLRRVLERTDAWTRQQRALFLLVQAIPDQATGLIRSLRLGFPLAYSTLRGPAVQ